MKKRFILPILALLLCATSAFGEITNSRIYDFRDGTIITNSKSDDGSLTLSGNFSKHSDQYGLNMKVDGQIKIVVSGSSTFRFLGSEYSKLNMVATSASGIDLGSQNTQATTDLVDVFDFVYSGGADTIIFKTTAGNGDDLYLPTIEVIPSQSGAIATTAEKNIPYFFDLRDGSIIPTTTDGQSGIDMGLIGIVVGNSNAYGYNGAEHGSILKTGNQITLKVAGNSYIKIGGCTYSNGTIAISSPTGQFDIASQDAQTATEFHVDGATVDFLYVGEATTITLDFTGTNYIPYIEIAPVTYEVTLTSYVQKSGTITINGVEIGLTSGADMASAADVTVSAGTVISATDKAASLYIDLGGNALSSYTPTFTGDIAAVDVSGDSLLITYTAPESNPISYILGISDNSQVTTAEAGKTYSYDFANGSELPQTDYNSLRYTTFISKDGILTLNSNTATESSQFGFHDTAHGAVFFSGNSLDIIVAGDATITFATCQYGSAEDAVFAFTDTEGKELSSIKATNIGVGAAGTSSFTYIGGAGVITATLISAASPTAEIYVHGVTIENAAIIEESAGKTEVWDFGAVELDTAIYKNNLTEDIINGWYDSSIEVGSAGPVLPSFSAGVLSWVGGGNDRLRTTNTNLTRYDANIGGVSGYTGRVYVNAGANPSRYMSLTLSDDDEVTIVTKTDAGGNLNFQYVAAPASQTDVVAIGSDLVELKFVAKEAGTYHIFDDKGKPSYFRIYRNDAIYHTLTGSVDVTAATEIPSNYAIIFTNEAGKVWTSTMSTGAYSVRLPVGYSYKMSLADANGYVINNGDEIEVTEATTTYAIAIQKVELYTVSGTITGLGDKLSALTLTYTPDPTASKIYQPEPVIDAGASTYSVQLEPNCKYTISADGVNDFYIPTNEVTISNSDATKEVVFAPKALYNVTINATGLTTAQLAKMSISFTNLNEEGYVYNFTSLEGITLRDGTYTIAYDGLDEYPVAIGMISNLKVDGADAAKTLTFSTVKSWSFDDKVITSATTVYKGMLFSGAVSNEIAKGHLNTKDGATVKIPVNVGDKVRVTYYYTADFSIEGGDALTTESNSTTTFEYTDYSYLGTDAGFVTITVGASAATTYFTNISIGETVNFTDTIYVGTDKEYTSINGALSAIGKMIRNNDERVTVMIDPGDYEEMLVVDLANITLKNASATPDIALANKGVDISANAVRITSYYGHGYDYYSMGNDQKWNAELLQVNKENGYLSYENEGSGTTNGSFWNATVVVTASGFVADDIIFENSFNQYISQKESEDVVEMWATGSKGERPTTYGSTDVQNKSFVERAAAISITNNVENVILYKCRVIGRQDSFYGGTGSSVFIYKGVMMGGTDYIFGAMTAVFYQSALAMNTSEDKNDVSYITAAQQSSGRGYLMYECTVTSATPGTESASEYRSKPGYFGRPWQATTSEVVFYNTTIETTNFPGSEGQSLIQPEGWNSSLGGESAFMYEFGTIEKSGTDNTASRSTWATLLSTAQLTDGTDITTANFTTVSNDWDPLAELIANDQSVGVPTMLASSDIKIHGYNSRLYISNVESNATVTIYGINGSLFSNFSINSDTNMGLQNGLWIVKVTTDNNQVITKVVIQ